MSKSKGVMERISCGLCEGKGRRIVVIRGDHSDRPCNACRGKGYRLKKKK